MGALARMRKQGKMRWIGVSNFCVDQMKRAMKIAPITSLQPPYSMLRRAIEAEILPFAQANGIGVINYSPMLSGLLAGKMTAERIAALPADDWRRKNVNSTSRVSTAICAWWSCSARSATSMASRPAWWPWPGRCTIPQLPQPSWAGAAHGRWKKRRRAHFRLSEDEYGASSGSSGESA